MRILDLLKGKTYHLYLDNLSIDNTRKLANLLFSLDTTVHIIAKKVFSFVVSEIEWIIIKCKSNRDKRKWAHICAPKHYLHTKKGVNANNYIFRDSSSLTDLQKGIRIES